MNLNIPESFERTLKICRRRKERGTADALKFLADQIVTSLGEVPQDAKTAVIFKIFGIFGSVFPQLSLPSELLDLLLYLVNELISSDRVEKAQTLLGAPFPPILDVPVMELKMKLYLHQGNTAEFEKVYQVWKARHVVAYSEIAQMLGFKKMDDGRWIRDSTHIALHEAPHEAPQEAPHEAPHEAPQEAPHDPVEETGEHDELLAHENVRVVTPPRRAKEDEKDMEGVCEVSHIAMVEEDEGCVSGLEKAHVTEGSGSALALVKERKHSRFQIYLDITVEELDDKSYIGSTQTNTTDVRKCFIVAQQPHIEHIEGLIDLCLTHRNLVKIDQSLHIMDDERRVLMTSENVCSVECFFRRKLSALLPEFVNSNEAWWRTIQVVFRKVFRGIVRGLMHLFVKGMACGDVAFCCFVTSEGEGRILPSMENKKQAADLLQLADLMTSVIRFCVPSDSDTAFLPSELKHFLWMIAYFKDIYDKRLCVPLEFFVDHPYFWDRKEKIDFSFNLRKVLKEIPKWNQISNYDALKEQLTHSGLYKDWWSKLADAYLAVYTKNGTRKHDYKNAADIVFYVCAVYSHINEREYRTARASKKLLEEQIESKLVEYFPDYHTSMFFHLCICRQIGKLTDEDLMRVSSVYSGGVGRSQYT